ncbi:MFS transporter [Sphingobium fluviale]|uniref:MFS transporter n=1 Tax=Sphingobium fluviale TaxID=2506423 RepID=A0A4Q1KFR3_9SPHN|nr:MFS transporter [Sphingobium fluviale]
MTGGLGIVNDVQKLLDETPMSRAQWTAVAIIGLLSALDGYDVLAMTFAAPGVSKEFGIDKAELGIALSSGLAGMALGSFFVAPLGDRYGRRFVVLFSLVLMGVGMLMSAFAGSVATLSGWRIFTGIGIGALIPVIAPLAAEFANSQHRRFAMAVMSVGYPLGGTLGGLAAAALLQHFSWHIIFLIGAGAALLLLAASLLWLPEPPAFLLAKRPTNALDKLNDFLRRCGKPPVSSLPAPAALLKSASSYAEIFGPSRRADTISITAVNVLFMTSVYYILSWMPQLVADIGHSASFATLASAMAACAGVVASLALGIWGKFIPLRWLVVCQTTGLAAAIVAFGLASHGVAVLLMLAALVGTFLYTSILGLYSAIVETFDPDVRSTGVGFVMGAGRIGAAITPAVAGALFQAGMGRESVSAVLSLGALMAAGIMI